ncbi:MAG: hypothetical protein ACM30I_00400 [Gemmatimonas sp.]
MLDTKEPLQSAKILHGERTLKDTRDSADQGRPEMVIVIGLVAVVSVAFGFVLGLLF